MIRGLLVLVQPFPRSDHAFAPGVEGLGRDGDEPRLRLVQNDEAMFEVVVRQH